MNFLFTWRYFKAKKSTNAVNIISWVSISAITLGTASLIVVLSVFNGLEQLVQSLYSAFYTDIRISAVNGKFISVSNDKLYQLKLLKGISAYSLTIEDKALLQYNGNQQIVVLKGVDSNYRNISGISQNISKGSFELGDAVHPAAVFGSGVASMLNLESDRSILPVLAYVFRSGPGINPADLNSSVHAEEMISSGSFKIQQDFDNKYVLTNLHFMQGMLGLDSNQYSAVEIQCGIASKANEIKKQAQALLGPGYKVQTRYEQNQTLFSVMRMEKWVIYAVLTLILIVAAFNMVGALTMLVLEKKKDIQVLKAMGANDLYIQRIFLNEGLLLAILGGAGGILLALIACWLQVKFKLVPLQGNFLIDYYPVKIIPGDLLLVGGTILIVALLASWLPSRKAAMQAFELKT
ncbi:MAG: FtsX-like permease family protein [Bacteroidota bacterium]|nr:FtsX-like permease family protein [Bacteroidota bacterium]MDP4249120.1 FtsX-like permease family protein [Bacteroidota bacterium]